MNSFNHYAYGAVGEWMYTTLAGLDTFGQYPGHKRLKLAPKFDERFDYVKASLETPHGHAVSAWELKNSMVTYSVTIPANTSARAILPGASVEGLKESGKALLEGDGVSDIRECNSDVTLEIGAGTYVFSWPWHRKIED
ncbi:MAG: alpha-L-rhamnosidase C-terminal domain-containing protein [Candidatus Sumerlaeota bacterium]